VGRVIHIDKGIRQVILIAKHSRRYKKKTQPANGWYKNNEEGS
jgi:hypothetical protein|tara:strand:+ start:1699 stop:1827 length:129 start_codon:yes stop_codon:yes gene_type:complete